MDETVIKVSAYVTHQGRLLAFSEPAYPEAGIQVPSGTVEPGEDLDAAVLREAAEETGLEALETRAYLGKKAYKFQSPSGQERRVIRHFFHLEYTGPATGTSWSHWEQDPSEGPDIAIEFELFWAVFPDEVPTLAGELGDLLHKLPAIT